MRNGCRIPRKIWSSEYRRVQRFELLAIWSLLVSLIIVAMTRASNILQAAHPITEEDVLEASLLRKPR